MSLCALLLFTKHSLNWWPSACILEFKVWDFLIFFRLCIAIFMKPQKHTPLKGEVMD